MTYEEARRAIDARKAAATARWHELNDASGGQMWLLGLVPSISVTREEAEALYTSPPADGNRLTTEITTARSASGRASGVE